ncbi:YARHG domain-containing protein [uncultured Aquimarina sp.]|uniref:YARHG domain-containing protein n=1 Tax=uncultured Aquimarina sp. TaxID=575652 RepID=UPI0026113A92|nr:YARHG domain-containing protein [uncultured Aquimarina sp.]
MNNSLLILFLFSSLCIFSNDGAYYASGNQLIPINETDICITKEILSIVKKTEYDKENDSKMDYAYVTVNYTFFNSSAEKTILVGFEAPSPSGDVNGHPIKGRHPYISKFDVTMNGQLLDHKTSIVNEETYYINNKINEKTENEVVGDDFDSNDPNFYYVYHFDAKFKQGINKIIHTYRFALSGSIMNEYSFDYILTAANRWGNHQIDDFTLNINMGDSESFYIQNTFFNDKDAWVIDNGRSVNSYSQYDEEPVSKFVIHTGGISFKKKNFKPRGELYLYVPQRYMKDNYEVFDYKQHDLPDKISIRDTKEHRNSEIHTCTYSIDEASFKILRNLPFAIRGYVFKTKIIQDYYLSQIWYKPNASYSLNLNTLSKEEKEWLKVVKQNTW